MSEPENPAAFPFQREVSLNNEAKFRNDHEGMTLRDWFAGQVAASAWRQALRQDAPNSSSEPNIRSLANRTAFWSYAIADAMLAERIK